MKMLDDIERPSRRLWSKAIAASTISGFGPPRVQTEDPPREFLEVARSSQGLEGPKYFRNPETRRANREARPTMSPCAAETVNMYRRLLRRDDVHFLAIPADREPRSSPSADRRWCAHFMEQHGDNRLIPPRVRVPGAYREARWVRSAGARAQSSYLSRTLPNASDPSSRVTSSIQRSDLLRRHHLFHRRPTSVNCLDRSPSRPGPVCRWTGAGWPVELLVRHDERERRIGERGTRPVPDPSACRARPCRSDRRCTRRRSRRRTRGSSWVPTRYAPPCPASSAPAPWLAVADRPAPRAPSGKRPGRIARTAARPSSLSG